MTRPSRTSPCPKAIVVESVGVELEMVDSASGARVAAMVDRTKLGEGTKVGSENFSSQDRFREGREALDE
jgi:hypothetical protein